MEPTYSRRQVLKGTGLGLTGLATLSLTGCNLFSSGKSGSAAATTHLEMLWWGGATRNEATRQALNVLGTKAKGITVGGDSTSWPGYWPKLASQVASGNPPDMMQMSIDYLAQYADRGALVDLKQFSSNQLNLADISQSSLARITQNGKLYAVPFGIGAQALVYDRSVMEAAKVVEKISPSWTWADMAAVAEASAAAVRSGKYGSAQYGIQDFSGQIYLAEIWLRQNGHEIYSTDLKSLGFPKEALVEWFDYWAKLRKSGAATSAAATQAILATTAEATGIAVMQAADSNQLISYQATTKHPLDLAIIPSTPGGSAGRYTEATMYLSVAAKSKQLSKSIEVANLLINDPDVGMKLGMERGVPESSKIAALVGASVSALGKVTIDYVELVAKHSQDPPPLGPKGAGNVTDALQRVAQEVAFGRKSSKQAVDAFFGEATKALG